MNEKEEIRSKALSGIIWKLAERFFAQFVSLSVSIVLARLLVPDDYSVVSIVAIFFIFCNVFISGGFNTALIQKKDADIIDYSSVLWMSLGISGIIYAVMFFVAPYLAQIYHKPLLIPVIRVMSLTFFVSAYKGVLCAYVSSNLLFKKFFWSTIGGTIISAVVGIIMAVCGFGPWALVAQQMTNAIIDTLILRLTTRLKLKLVISFKRLKGLFSYGSKIFLTSIIGAIYDEIKPLIVGIKFSAVDLAFYNKGKSFPQLINSSVSDSLSAVLFPVIAKFQDDKSQVLNVTRKFMRVSSYVLFPLLVGVFVISDNFVLFLLTEKWLPASPYIKIFCATYMFYLMQIGNLQAIRAIGRSDIILILEIVKKAINFIIIGIYVWLSDNAILLALSSVVCSLIAFIINAYPNRKLLSYGYVKQISDLLPNFVLSAMMGVVVYFAGMVPVVLILKLIIQIFAGILSYVFLSVVTKNSSFKYLLNMIKERISN